MTFLVFASLLFKYLMKQDKITLVAECIRLNTSSLMIQIFSNRAFDCVSSKLASLEQTLVHLKVQF